MFVFSKTHKYVAATTLLGAGTGMLCFWVSQYLFWNAHMRTSAAQVALAEDEGSVLGVQTELTSFEAVTKKITELEKRIAALEKKTSATTKTTKSVIREEPVFIGSGASSSTNWTDIDSASIELNSVNYPGVKQVVFEATLSIVGGEASARLKNKTTGGIIYLSEVKHNSNTPAVKLSAPFVLASGSNEYVVQVRSSSNEIVQVHGARLRLQYE